MILILFNIQRYVVDAKSIMGIFSLIFQRLLKPVHAEVPEDFIKDRKNCGRLM